MGATWPVFGAPSVLVVRGPSGSGKTALIEALVARLADAGVTAAYVKRTHHELDLPAKGSSRVWSQGPAAMVLRAPDRLQLTVAAGDGSTAAMLAAVPAGIDLVLLETHTPEPYPTTLSTLMEPAAGEDVVGRFTLFEPLAESLVAAALRMLPADRTLDRALQAAIAVHGGRGCAGLVLGTRLALAGLDVLGLSADAASPGLVVTVETSRCGADAVQAVTGCRLGRGTLRVLDYGKMAATFCDTETRSAIRVAARGDLRVRASVGVDPRGRRAAQRAAYLSMSRDELFVVQPVPFSLSPDELPGAPPRRAVCFACGEEVAGGRELRTELGTCCRGCAAVRGEPLEATG